MMYCGFLYLHWLLRKLKKCNKKRGSEIAHSVIIADKCIFYKIVYNHTTVYMFEVYPQKLCRCLISWLWKRWLKSSFLASETKVSVCHHQVSGNVGTAGWEKTNKLWLPRWISKGSHITSTLCLWNGWKVHYDFKYRYLNFKRNFWFRWQSEEN